MRYDPDQKYVAYIEDHWGQDQDKANPPFLTAGDLCSEHKSMRPPVIHGLLREGETMNVIAAPKTGKSWLVLNLSLSVVTSLPWLGFNTEPGNVLLIDNELHPETLGDRIPRVAKAMKLPERTWKDTLHVKSFSIALCPEAWTKTTTARWPVSTTSLIAMQRICKRASC